jgi:hypothetical protein
MHPLQAGLLARQHIAERHEEAAARRRAAAASHLRVPILRRAGWALVQLGLHLAVGSADA